MKVGAHQRQVLRDRYYLGIVTYDGIEYPGRHAPLTTEEVFGKVQIILDSHSGAGAREWSYNHYLKGTLWCARCKHRFIVQRAVGDGGEYFYWLCRGRQKGLCDQPYIPVAIIEEAVIRYYGDVLSVGPVWLEAVRTGVAEAVAAERGLPYDLREQYEKRLEALDRKESYFLDLAAEEEWPKAKLRERIDIVRQEAADIRKTLERADQHLELGQQIIEDALALHASPQDTYARGDETVRTLLNKAFFTKLYVDGEKITGHDFHEPFDKLLGAYEEYVIARARILSDDLGRQSAEALKGSGTENRGSAAGPNLLTWQVSGWSTTAMVDLTGIETGRPPARLRAACAVVQ